MNFQGHTLWERVQVCSIWLTWLTDEMLIVFALKSCTFKSVCFPVNLGDTSWLLSGWLSGWLVSWDSAQGVSGYSEPALGHLSTSCQGETRVTQTGKSVSALRAHRTFHAWWAQLCSQAFISNLSEKWLWWFFFKLLLRNRHLVRTIWHSNHSPLDTTVLSSMRPTGALIVSRLSRKRV